MPYLSPPTLGISCLQDTGAPGGPWPCPKLSNEGTAELPVT